MENPVRHFAGDILIFYGHKLGWGLIVLFPITSRYPLFYPHVIVRFTPQV
jgi:hypothetical protein